jgi:AcrR family transcriptional regulator
VSDLRRGIRTRHAIDRAATTLFAELGYHATSIRAIAAAANVQPAAIYHWYPSKEAILSQLQNDFLRDLTTAVEAAVARQVLPAHQLAAAVREHVVFHGLHSQEAFVTDSEIRALGADARRELISKRDDYQRYFNQMIAAGIADTTLQAVEPRIATYAILLQCTGVALWYRPTGPMTIDDVADIHVELALASLHAAPDLIASAIDAIQPA